MTDDQLNCGKVVASLLESVVFSLVCFRIVPFARNCVVGASRCPVFSVSQSSEDDEPHPLKGEESGRVEYTKGEEPGESRLPCSAAPSPAARAVEKSGDEEGEDGRTTEGDLGDSSHFEEETAPSKGVENGHREHGQGGVESRPQHEADGCGSSEGNRDRYPGPPPKGKPTWQVSRSKSQGCTLWNSCC